MGTRQGRIGVVRNITTKPAKMKDVVSVFPHIVVYGAKYIYLGENVSFNDFCHLTATKDARIYIGNDVLIGPYVMMNTGDHGFESRHLKIREQPCKRNKIVIGNDVWICARVTILRGSVIPDGCVIGACSLVTLHDKLEKYSVYVGNPLRKIKTRK